MKVSISLPRATDTSAFKSQGFLMRFYIDGIEVANFDLDTLCNISLYSNWDDKYLYGNAGIYRDCEVYYENDDRYGSFDLNYKVKDMELCPTTTIDDIKKFIRENYTNEDIEDSISLDQYQDNLTVAGVDGSDLSPMNVLMVLIGQTDFNDLDYVVASVCNRIELEHIYLNESPTIKGLLELSKDSIKEIEYQLRDSMHLVYSSLDKGPDFQLMRLDDSILVHGVMKYNKDFQIERSQFGDKSQYTRNRFVYLKDLSNGEFYMMNYGVIQATRKETDQDDELRSRILSKMRERKY